MIRTIVRLERASLHKGVGLIFAGNTREVLAQVPLKEIAMLLEGRQQAYYYARLEKNGPIHLGEEVSSDQLPK